MGVSLAHNDFDRFEGVQVVNSTNQKDMSIEVSLTLRNACIMFYGVHSNVISKLVLSKCVQLILTKYSNLTIQELAYCYERKPIERSVTVTVDQLLQPVKTYLSTKERIRIESLKLSEEEIEEENSILQIQKHSERCVNIYKDCLKENRPFKFERCEFYALTLAKNQLNKSISAEQKETLWKLGVEDYFRMKDQEEELRLNYTMPGLENMGKTKESFYALRIVNLCLENKIEI